MHGFRRVRWPGEPSNRPAQLRPGHKTAWIPASPSWSSSTTMGSRASRLLARLRREDHTHDDCGVQGRPPESVARTQLVRVPVNVSLGPTGWCTSQGKLVPPREPPLSAAPGRTRKKCAQVCGELRARWSLLLLPGCSAQPSRPSSAAHERAAFFIRRPSPP